MAQISFTGRAGKDPALTFTADGKAMLRVSVAEGHREKNRDTGQWEDGATTWRQVVLFGRMAEALAEQVRKGSLLQVSGREETREWTKDGEQHSLLSVTADSIGVVPTPAPQQGGFTQQRQQPQGDPWGQQSQIDSSGWDNGSSGAYDGNAPY